MGLSQTAFGFLIFFVSGWTLAVSFSALARSAVSFPVLATTQIDALKFSLVKWLYAGKVEKGFDARAALGGRYLGYLPGLFRHHPSASDSSLKLFSRIDAVLEVFPYANVRRMPKLPRPGERTIAGWISGRRRRNGQRRFH